MKVTTPEISWHERDPIYSVDLQPGNHKIRRLVSGGVDKFVRVWQVVEDSDGKIGVDFLANLKRHTKAVNVCRFSHDGETLATAGDDSVIIFWKLNNSDPSSFNIFQEDEEDNKENWSLHKVLRGHLEDIYDLCWSADSKYMISGSVDNSAILWDLIKDQKIALLNDHQSFVQGVAWDPMNEFAATLCTDRSCRVFSIASGTCLHNIKKMSMPSSNKSSPTDNKDSKDVKPKSFRMFHDDTMRSFFRRLTFTPDGEILIVPSGVMETDPVINSTYMFTRHSFSKPAVYLPSPEKVTIAVRCCPIKFKLRQVIRNQQHDQDKGDLKEWEKYDTLFQLPYRMVFSVATEDSILLYDTQQKQPFGFITNVHYHQLSDLTWASDGRYMVVSSTDGYCTLVTFEDGELGVPYKDIEAENVEDSATAMQTEEKTDVAMETDQSSDDLHLVLDTSNDGSDMKNEDGNIKIEESPTNKISQTQSLEMKVKTKDGKPKRVEITTLTSYNRGDSSNTCESKSMEMKVKSADGTPKNIQITTLSCGNENSSNVPRHPEIQVRSVDGKPKRVQITTLATFGSPKSTKQHNVTSPQTSTKHEDSKELKILAEKTENTDSVNEKITDDVAKAVCQTSKQSEPREEKQTPKRVQVTTLQLFQSPSSKQKSNNENDR